MTFPQTPRNMLYELQIGATDWANITPYVFSLRQVTEITRGVPGEYSVADPSSLGFQINNKLGYFSPRNPNSPLYGLIGRNTPVRVSIGEGKHGLVTVDNGNGSVWSPDSVASSFTTDIDIRVDLEILPDSTDTWAVGTFDLASKYDNSDAERSWLLRVSNGVVQLYWWPLGTVASQRSAFSALTIPAPTTGRRCIRATLDVVNGTNCTATFYTAPDINGSWTVLGSPVSAAPTTALFDGTAGTRVGAAGTGFFSGTPKAVYYKAEIRNGINGTLVHSPDFTAQTYDRVPFASSTFLDAQGNAWTPIGSADNARIWDGDVDVRSYVECSAFPNAWDTSGNDAWVQIGAAGYLRRLGNGQEPAQTGLRDWIMGQSPPPTSYFPLSGAEGTRYSVNLGDIGTNSFRFYPEGAPVYAYGKDFGTTYLGSAMELNATGDTADLRGDVATADDNFALDFVFQSPVITTDTGTLETNMGVLDIVVWTYDYDRIKLRMQDPANGGTMQLFFYPGDGGGSSSITASAAIPQLQDNAVHTCRLAVRTTGGGLSQTAEVYIDGSMVYSGSFATLHGINGTWMYQLFYSRYAGQTVVNLGHLTLWSDAGAPAPPAVGDFYDAAMGYSGELAADRMVRIAGLGGIPFSVVGNNADTMPMGPQYSESKLTQLRDAEQADMGYLIEPRASFGLAYRTRVSMVGQSPALTLSYASGHLVDLKPTDDDLLTKNDMTATRREGDSYRYRLTTGRLSVQDPPNGVGQYHDQAEFNVETDAMLSGIAAWLVNLGTVDQARYPSVTVDLGILAGYGLDEAARAIDTGDLLVITDMDALGVYEPVRLLVLGTGSETISEGGYRHTITWNCAPYQGYEGSVFATSASSGSARYDTNGSTLAVGVSSSATSLSIASTGTLWTTDPAAFPFDILMAGERITLSAISGASSPQTATVSARSVNSVVKAHTAGADIRLADPAYYSL